MQLTEYLKGIADAIRENTKTTDSIAASDFKNEISALKVRVDTTDANAISEQILAGATAYVDGQKVEGIIENYNGSFDGNAEPYVPAGKLKIPNGTKFGYCTSGEILKSIDTSEIQDMSSFFDTTKATELDLTLVDTSNATDMSYMFYNGQKLATADFSKWNTSKVENFESFLYQCYALAEIDISSFDMSSAKTVRWMFGRDRMTKIILPQNCNLANVEDASYMFGICNNLVEVNTENLTGGNNCGTVNRMFFQCYALPEVNLSNFDLSSVEDAGEMFESCSAITKITFGEKAFSSKLTLMSEMFYGCSSLVDLDISNFDLSGITDGITRPFTNCSKLSDDSLNSIMAALATGTNIKTNKRYLTYLGLTEDQANKMTTMSNWPALQALGWTVN